MKWIGIRQQLEAAQREYERRTLNLELETWILRYCLQFTSWALLDKSPPISTCFHVCKIRCLKKITSSVHSSFRGTTHAVGSWWGLVAWSAMWVSYPLEKPDYVEIWENRKQEDTHLLPTPIIELQSHNILRSRRTVADLTPRPPSKCQRNQHCSAHSKC